MATIINNPPANTDNSGQGAGLIIGLIVLLIIAYLGFVYGLPAIRYRQFRSPQINIPSKIDVNVNQAK